jgi:hypothetical protein
MSLPNFEDLDAMAMLVAGKPLQFSHLGPEARLQVLTLVNQRDLIDTIENLPIAIVESEPFMTLASKFTNIDTHLHNIASDFDVLSDWFNRSTPLDMYKFKG